MNTEVIDRPAIEPTTALTEQVKSEVGALALLTIDPKTYVAEIFNPFRSKLAALIEVSDKVECDITTTAGMAVAVAQRAGFRDDVRLAAEKIKKVRKAPILEIGRLLDSTFNEIIAEAAPHETKWDKAIDAEKDRKEAEKAAKIKAERERTEAIQARIAKIIAIPADVAGMQSSYISDEFDALTDLEIDDSFDTFRAAAETAKADTLVKLQGMVDKAKSSEQATHEAEQARIAEIARIAADRAEHERLAEIERAELARLRAENERIANEQAAERQRLADLAAAQELAAKQLRDKAEANLQAERDAQVEQMRIERERVAAEQAKAATEIKAQQDKLAAQQAAADARDAAALAAQQDAQRLNDDHGPALAMNAEFDAAAALEQLPGAIAEMFEAMEDDSAHRARCTETANAMLTNGRSTAMSLEELADSIGDGDPDSEPTDIEIIDVCVENFGGTRAQAVARLLAFVGEEVAA